MLSKMTGRARGATFALIVIGVTAALSTALIQSGANDGAGDAQAGAARSNAARSPHDPASVLGVLNRAARSDDRMPEQLVTALGRGGEFGTDASRSRRLLAPAQFGGMWVVPGATGACLVQAAGGSAAQTCGTSEQIAAGDLIGTNGGEASGLPEDQRLLFGPVPDGVDSVTVTFEDGRDVMTVPVSGNSLAAVVPNVDGRVQFQSKDGPIEVAIYAG